MKLQDAIYALYPNIKSTIGDDAFDADGKLVQYDKALVETKLLELQQAQKQAQKAAEASKASAIAKLTALGLSTDEIKAMTGDQS